MTLPVCNVCEDFDVNVGDSVSKFSDGMKIGDDIFNVVSSLRLQRDIVLVK